MITTSVNCESCGQVTANPRTAFVNGVYYSIICSRCLGDSSDELNSTAAGYERRRQYEEHAEDVVQPYNANGPNVEFLRLYPEAAAKVFDKATIAQLKRKI